MGGPVCHYGRLWDMYVSRTMPRSGWRVKGDYMTSVFHFIIVHTICVFIFCVGMCYTFITCFFLTKILFRKHKSDS